MSVRSINITVTVTVSAPGDVLDGVDSIPLTQAVLDRLLPHPDDAIMLSGSISNRLPENVRMQVVVASWSDWR